MSTLTWLVAAIVVANLASIMYRTSAWTPAQRRTGTGATAALLVVLVATAALARPVARGGDVSAESVEMAAGLVLAAGGLVRTFAPLRPFEAAPAGQPWSWLVPVLFPYLLAPEMVMFTLAASLRLDAVPMLIVVSGGVASVLPAWAGWRLAPIVTAGAARLVAAGQVVAGVVLVVDGLRAV